MPKLASQPSLLRRTGRRAPSARQSRLSALWRFLNSSFAIWLLSTIFISLASFAYQQFSASSQAKLMKSERVRQLDAEIDWRINNRRVLDALRDNNGKFVANRPLTSRETDQAFAALTKPFEDEYALYDQFARRNLFSLMHELASLLPEPSKDCVRRASYKLERIRIPESPDEPITPKLFIVRMNEVGDLRWHEFPHKFASDGRSQGIDRAKIDALKNMGCERSEG